MFSLRVHDSKDSQLLEHDILKEHDYSKKYQIDIFSIGNTQKDEIFLIARKLFLPKINLL